MPGESAQKLFVFKRHPLWFWNYIGQKHLFSSSATEQLGNRHFMKHLLLGLAETNLESKLQYCTVPQTQARLRLCAFALGHFSR